MSGYFDIEAPLYIPQRLLHKKCSKGKDPALIVTRFPTHWKYYCHRCEWTGEKRMGHLSPKQVVKLIQQTKFTQPVTKIREVVLPADFSPDIPAKGLTWLYNYDLTDKEIRDNNIGWSSQYGRVILPVYMDDHLVYWQGRLLEEPTTHRPKYINVWQAGREDVYFTTGDTSSKTVVLVEDILSAIKVGRVVMSTSLLGVYIPNKMMLNYKAQDVDVVIWLDPDKYVAVIRYVLKFSNFGCNVRMIHTEHDPKYYSTTQIERRLNVHSR